MSEVPDYRLTKESMMTHKGRTVLFAMGCIAVSSNADLVLSNTDTLSGRQVLQRETSVGNWHATPITTDGFDYTLTSISTEISDFNPAGTLFLEIWSVSGVATPGSSLGRLSLTQSSISNKTFSGSISLIADTSYFVVTGVDNGGGQWFESVNQSDPLGSKDFNIDLGPWTLETLFSGSSIKTSYQSDDFGEVWQSDALLSAPLRMVIQADVVPEPSVIALIGFGGLSVIISRRIQSAIKSSEKDQR